VLRAKARRKAAPKRWDEGKKDEGPIIDAEVVMRRSEAAKSLNRYNRKRIWPKLVVTVSNDIRRFSASTHLTI